MQLGLPFAACWQNLAITTRDVQSTAWLSVWEVATRTPGLCLVETFCCTCRCEEQGNNAQPRGCSVKVCAITSLLARV